VGQNFPLFPERASSVAGGVDMLFVLLVVVAVFFSVLIGVGIFYLSFRYRRRPGNEVGQLVPGSQALEITWMVIPFLIAMVLFAWGAKLYVTMRQSPSDALNIYVVGKQWMWKIQHSDGRREFNELHVPVNRDVELTMISEDVIHDFFVPAFRVKMDVLPGRYTTLWFRPTKTGRYHLFCSQYCGTNHSVMGGWVDVMEPSEYQAWLSGGSNSESPEQSGQRLFTTLACVSCHGDPSEAGAGPRAPSLRGVYGSTVKLSDGSTVTADDAYVRESILDPGAKIVAGYDNIMPTFQGVVSEDQLLQLLAYIKSLGTQPAQSASGNTGPAAPAAAAAQ
jgi:cytochrome c oxidase subunit 2